MLSYRRETVLQGVLVLNNFIHHKSGSNEYKNKQTNITKLTLSSTYINRSVLVNHVSWPKVEDWICETILLRTL